MNIDLKKLTNEQLVVMYQNERDENVFNVLYNRNINVIKDTTRKFYEIDKILYSYEDYEQIASIAFLKAVNSFDCSKELKFTTLLYPTIKHDLGRQLKKTKSIKNNGRGKGYGHVSNSDKLLKDEVNSLEYGETYSYESKVFESPNADRLIEQEFLTVFNGIKSNLKKQDLDLLNNILQGKTQNQIGDEMGITRQRVSQKVGKLRKLIKEELELKI
jgi:RNA polymerase sigma factor (sigma-70 family)